MSKTTFTALTPAGTTVSRASASRTYTHVVLIRSTVPDGWAAYGWATDDEQAHRKARAAVNAGLPDVRVVPVLTASTRSTISY